MPELPEVEIARRQLDAWLRGARVVRARCDDAHVTRKSPIAFGRALEGATIRDVERRGKWLKLSLSNDRFVFSHLGMAGKWALADGEDARTMRAERARIDVVRHRKRSSVRYVDTRRFGRLIVAREDIGEWTELGRDPLADGLDARSLGAAIASVRRSIKETLLDQTVIAGVGNIVATEALFRARIDPRSRAHALGPRDLVALSRAIHATIAAGIAEHERESLRYLHEIEGESPFLVYGRAGEACPRCGAKVAKLVLGGRTTALCPRCQTRRR